MEYEQEFKIFSANINSASRAFYYYKEINSQVYQDGLWHEGLDEGCFQDSKKYQAIQVNAQFWNDYDNMSIQQVIITLGRIFSPEKSRGNESHCLDRLLRITRATDVFKKEHLKKRKIQDSQNYEDWIDDYMSSAHELSSEDFAELNSFSDALKKLWDDIKDVRNKIYAHQDKLSDKRKSNILKKAEYSKIENILHSLLTLENILWQAYHNGEKPDFLYKNNRIEQYVKKDVEVLLKQLAK